jgi:signal transduction histidine kinase
MEKNDSAVNGMDAKDIAPIKPFKLVKYFTFISLVVVLVGALALSTVIAHRAETVLLKKSEDYALLMAENLNHQVFLQFIVPAALQFGQVIQLQNKVLFDRLDKVVRSTLHSFSVETVNIFDRNENVIFYSFDKELLGRKGLGGIDYKQALEGKSRSKLTRSGGFWGMLFGAPTESKLRTYVPLRAERPLSNMEGPILGVFEIVQDLSDDYRVITAFKYRIIFISFVIMGLLFLVLRHFVKRGEQIIEKRAQERLLLKEKLGNAQRLASLGEMVAGISHEIRNPLGIISSTGELLKQKLAPTAPEVELADVIVQEANRLNSIVTDFLDFARPQAPDFMPCKVDDVIEKILAFLAPEVTRNGYRIHKRFATDIPEVQADPGLLYQAFLNILINAMQAMPEGGNIYIELSFQKYTLAIVFSDEGPGIPDETLNRIWEPFFTSKDKGSGLGLPIVKKIVEGHGGIIEVDNRPEKGIQVAVTLPVERYSEAEAKGMF